MKKREADDAAKRAAAAAATIPLAMTDAAGNIIPTSGVFSLPQVDTGVVATTSTAQSEPALRMQGTSIQDSTRSLTQKEERPPAAESHHNRRLPNEPRGRLGDSDDSSDSVIDQNADDYSTGQSKNTDHQDDYGLQEAEDSVSRQVLQELSEQSKWPGN